MCEMNVNINNRVFKFDGLSLQILHICQKGRPAHAKEGREDNLVARRYEGKVHCLHTGPINYAHTIGLEEFVTHLQRENIEIEIKLQ